MKNVVGPVLACVLTALLPSCAETGEPGPAEPEGASVTTDAASTAVSPIDLGDPALSVGAPLREGSLTLWPIHRTGDSSPVAGEEAVSYLTLDDALRSGEAEVLETGDVGRLQLVNHASEPLLLLAGEVLAGGKQDRIVARDTLVAAGRTVPLASFCVEQGRWHAEGGAASGRRFSSAAALASSPVRRAAQVSKQQQAVWSSVAYATSANNASTTTGTYVALLENEQVHRAVEERAAALLAALEKTRGVVGLVTALDHGEDDEVVAAEVFRDPSLFDAFRAKLVRAYVLDAVTREKAGTIEVAAIGDVYDSVNACRGLGYGGEAPLLSASAFEAALFEQDPDLQVTDEAVEAGAADLKHLHRTLYKR